MDLFDNVSKDQDIDKSEYAVFTSEHMRDMSKTLGRVMKSFV